MTDTEHPTRPTTAATEVEGFTPDVRRRPKNRPTQLLAVAALLVALLGGLLAIGGMVWLGLCLLVGGLVVLIATAVWAVRHWDY